MSSRRPAGSSAPSHAACDATVIAMRAADLGIELARLEVVVDSERTIAVCLAWTTPCPLALFARASAWRSPLRGSPESQLRAIVDWAHRHSPVDDAVARAVPIAFHVTSD